MKNQWTFLSVMLAMFWGISQAVSAQSSCATAVDATLGANQAPAMQEFWYRFSVIGQPLAQYYANYDSKSLDVSVAVFAGTCDNLLGQGSSIPAIEGDTRTYYIRFTWNSGTPLTFEWELYQFLIVPMTGIEVTPSSYSLAFGESFLIDNVFTVSPVPANTTQSFLTEYHLIDSYGIIDPPIFQANNPTLTAIGSGTARLAFFATNRSDYSSFGADTVTINIAAPALCSSATTIFAGVNTAQAAQEQWFRFMATTSGIYSINHGAIDIDNDGKNDLFTNWTVYKGDCNNLRQQETPYLNGAQCSFKAEAGQIYSIKLYQPGYYGLTTFDFTLESPKSVTGFNLTTKQLDIDLYTGYDLAGLGLNFTPADATDKGLSVEVRDTSIIELWEDGQAIIYKDAINAKKEGSTHVVFTTHDGGFKDSCLVTVKRIHLTSFQLSFHEKTLWLPYGSSGEYVNINNINDTSALRVIFTPANATDKSYTVAIRNKGIVKYDGYSLQANREGSTYVVFTANDGGLRDSILINVTRTTTGGSPCENAAAAQLGNNTMPAAENHTEWFTFTPVEAANYALTINVEKYPFTGVEVYTGDCQSLYLLNDGRLGSVNEYGYGAGFFGEAGNRYYLKLTTEDYNTPGGGTIVPYTWEIAKISASISGTVTDNGVAAQGNVELYSTKNGSATLLQTAGIQANGAYQFDNLGAEHYAIRAVTTAGNITWQGSNTPYFVENAVITPTGSGAITGKDISIIRPATLNEGNAGISGYIVKSEVVVPSIRRVKSAEGNPAAGITVFLLRATESTPVTYTTTNTEGYFEFTGLGVGEYRIRIQALELLEETETTEVSITGEGQNVELAYEISETGIEETSALTRTSEIQGISVFPNPVQDELQIAGFRAGNVIEIVDLFGRLVVTARENVIDVSHLPKGVYLVKIISGNQSVTKKIIKP
ncbi:MAG: carboxypeptidase regulatory-like domain-containing protein [Tannerella sp.]|jgi:uncharacterized protein YjdB/5-hydroxyisourate hydrolase-like protein (transthyretin family)|nr:carboxypeptidase regulatory-like domain-containing protein [Tannerella sp.]